MSKLLLTFLLHFISLPDSTFGQAGSPLCDLNEFPRPYVKVLEKRNGPHIDTLERSGFLDMTKYIHKLICVNGAAVVYQDVSLNGPKNDSRIYFNGELQAYSHQCFIINQISTAKAIELRDSHNENPTLYDVELHDVIGKRVTGVYLVSEPVNLYFSTSVMFIQKNWDYIVTDSDYVSDGSFITIGSGPFCLSVNEKFDIVLTGKNITDESVCKWTMNDGISVTAKFQKRYDAIFNGNVSRQSLQWHSCGIGAGGSGGGLGPYPNNLTLSSTTEAPKTNLDPFSIIDPKFWSSKGRSKSSQRIISGPFFIGNETNYNDTAEITEEEMLQNLLIDLDPTMCIQLRPKLVTIDPACTIDGNADQAGGDMLLAVLTIEDVPPPAIPTKLKDDLEWKNEIMDLASEIFGKICEAFAPTMPFTIARVVAYYLAKAHNIDPAISPIERDVWKFLKSELQRCNDGIKKPMLWYWDNREDLMSPQIAECKIESCSFGCLPSHDGQKCESKQGTDCVNSVPICDGVCTFDNTSNSCTDLNSVADVCLPPSKCDNEDCGFDDNTKTCSATFCLPKTCMNPSTCVPNGESCMDRQVAAVGSNGGGAYPSAGELDPLSALLTSAGGSSLGVSMDGLPNLGLSGSYFKVVDTNEAIHPVTGRSYNFNGYPVNILVITQIMKKNSKGRTIMADIDANTTIVGECLYFYEDMAETDYELNIAIDIHWKIWATVIGYCNNFYQLRKSETFPRLYNTYYEDFLQPIASDWKNPKENEYLRIILSEFNSEKSQKWLDTCLESSYHVSNSSTYRPPRPLTIGGEDALQSNYFLQIPDFIQAQFHTIDLSKSNQTVRCA